MHCFAHANVVYSYPIDCADRDRSSVDSQLERALDRTSFSEVRLEPPFIHHTERYPLCASVSSTVPDLRDI